MRKPATNAPRRLTSCHRRIGAVEPINDVPRASEMFKRGLEGAVRFLRGLAIVLDRLSSSGNLKFRKANYWNRPSGISAESPLTAPTKSRNSPVIDGLLAVSRPEADDCNSRRCTR